MKRREHNMRRGCFQCSWTRIFVPLVFFIITSVFISAGLDWVLVQRRTSLQAILTRMNPHFIHVEVNAPTEGYYRLWRYHDFGSDSHRKPRKSGFPAVPVVYVHGNSGSFQDMRSLGRYVGEANVNERRRHILEFEERVQMKLFGLYKSEGRKMPIDGEEIPRDLQMKAEDMVITEAPLLGVELFGVDFLEESNIQSGVLLLKEARFLNHSMHRLMQGFLDHYEALLRQPRGSIRVETDKNNPTLTAVAEAERDYINSLCMGGSFSVPNGMFACTEAKKQIREFSSMERLRREVERVRSDGLWMWTESVGGIVALFAALIAPELFAGIVMAGSPSLYPPLLFDSGSTAFQRVLHNVIFPLPPASSLTVHWPELNGTVSPRALLAELTAASPEDIASRAARVIFINLNGGALEDIVPPRSSALLRMDGRSTSSEKHKRLRREVPPPIRRRDISTEELRGCGMPLTHRGLVFARQLLDVAANSLVRAALSSHPWELIRSESSLTDARERLFPTVVETLPKAKDRYLYEEFYFTKTLEKITGAGTYRKANMTYAQSNLKTICVDGSTLVNVQDIPSDEDPDTESWQSLHLFIGVTTYEPEDVLLPELHLMHVDEKISVPYTNIHARAATKLHLAKRIKDSEPIEGSVLSTAVSFQVLRKSTVNLPIWVRPRFCFLLNQSKFSNHHFSYVQHDMIDPLHERSAPDVRQTAITSQRSEGMSLERHGRFTLVRNVDSMIMETNMVVRVKNRVVFPHVICGSFRSFRVAFRGTEELAFDEPESQLQYFFGPYETERDYFHYSWQPFHGRSVNTSNVFLVYVLTADEQPDIRLLDFERYEYPKWGEIGYVLWWISQWTMRWMAILATYSLSGRYVACYALVFLTLYTVFSAPYFLGNGVPSRALSRRIHGVSPVLFVVITGVVLEWCGNTLVKDTLSICLNDDLPILSDDELTTMMGLGEKLMLTFFYALPPRYEACKYSWIRLLTVSPDNVHIEFTLHMICAFCVASVLVLLEFGAHCLLGTVAVVSRYILTTCRIKIREKVVPYGMIGFWSIPICLLLFVPWLHISLITTLTCMFAYSVIWFIPREAEIENGPRYRWICFMLTMIFHFTAHFQGLVLVVRNYFIVPSIVLRDSERMEPSREDLLTFAVTQSALAVVYGTVYLTQRHVAGVKSYTNLKAKEIKERVKIGLKKEAKEETNDVHQKGCNGIEHEKSVYVLGDIGRQHFRFKWVTQMMRPLLCLASVWACMISLRRPLEGSVASVGLCLTGTYIAVLLLQLW